MAKKRSTREKPEEMWEHVGADLNWFKWSWDKLHEPITELENILARFNPQDQPTEQVKELLAEVLAQLQKISANCPMTAGPNPPHLGQKTCVAPSMPVPVRRSTKRRKS